MSALNQKLLIQARMEVLEEEEIRHIKEKQREFEQVRNEELSEAQRFDASEQRIQFEIERRKIQQKLSKEMEIITHQKLITRIISKDLLQTMKFKSLKILEGKGIFRDKFLFEIASDLIPWIYDETFLYVKNKLKNLPSI